jgi:DNA modification methylase
MAEHSEKVMSHYKTSRVYEPFCGSGTTMVACENLHRKCRAIEISANYCAVILERMNTAFPDLKIERL